MSLVKYRIFLTESEAGWGQERWTEDYDTFEEAQERIREVNSRNTAETAPSWYVIAEQYVEAVSAFPTVPN